MRDVRKFAAFPLNAIGHPGISRKDIDVLAVVAWHDGMGRNGMGCTASHHTIAAEARTDVTSVSRSLTKLVSLGLVRGERSPRDRRRRVYHVIYKDNPRMLGSVANHSAHEGADTPIVGSAANQFVGNGAKYSGEILGKPENQAAEITPKFAHKRISLREKRKEITRSVAARQGVVTAPAGGKHQAEQAIHRRLQELGVDVQRSIGSALQGEAYQRALAMAINAECEIAGSGSRVLMTAAGLP